MPVANAHTAIQEHLIIRKGLAFVRSVPLDRSPLQIGRTPDADIQLDHQSVSRRHAQLTRTRDGWRVADAGSTNGVLLNGERITAAQLRPGDVIDIRPFTLQFNADAGGATDLSLVLTDSSAITQVARRSTLPQALHRQRLEELYGLARLVMRRSESGSLWPSVQNALRRSLHAERCVVIGLDQAGQPYRLHPPRVQDAHGEPLGVSQSVLRSVVQKRESVLVERVDAHVAYAEAMSLAGAGVGSVICVPVILHNQVRAIVYADRHQTVAPFRDEDLSFVSAAVELAAAAVELDELHDQNRELAHLRGRLAAAREIQEMLLPQPIPQPRWGAVAARNYPADTMSGDIYDVHLDPQGRLVVMLADVAGKGVPASLITATLQSTLRVSLDEGADLKSTVNRLNRAIDTHHREGLFATMLLARWSADGTRIELVNCGHHAPLWLRRDGTVEEFADRIGMALGVDTEWHGQILEIDATPYRAMMVFSDGVTEARNAQHEEFGTERSKAVLASGSHENAEADVEALAQAVHNFCRPGEPEDDVTILQVWRS